jgi:hypothetical protein
MKDPFPIPQIPWLRDAVTPLSARLNFPTLPLHIHEVVFATGLYTFVHLIVSPRLSLWLAPTRYPTDRGKRANWDSHVVSLFQAVLINVLALWTMAVDQERKDMVDWQRRIFGYSGGCGLVQSFAAGYFVWDLAVSTYYLDVFGLGMFAHALSALSIYMLGYVSVVWWSFLVPQSGGGLWSQLGVTHIHTYGPFLPLTQQPTNRDPFSTSTARRSSSTSSRRPS